MRTVVVLVLLLGAACGNSINSTDSARIAYLGVDKVVSKSLALGFTGFNAAQNANIPDQSADRDDTGTRQGSGQVDQGASDNRTMTLSAALSTYSDGELDDPTTDGEEHFKITYDTADGKPLSISLHLTNVPNGTLDG